VEQGLRPADLSDLPFELFAACGHCDEIVLDQGSWDAIHDGLDKLLSLNLELHELSATRRATADQMEDRILWQQLLAKLSPLERQVCQWKRDGLSGKEIASLRSGSPAAVDSLWLRIRKKLRMAAITLQNSR
jgi:DNA-binding CsgD family transcriptional regulator